jgi:hypothetical protein
MENERPARTAMYLAGHGSKTKPRLIELQHQRILRYRRAFLQQYQILDKFPVAFVDLQLPRFGMGIYDLNDVPGFNALYKQVQEQQFDIVYMDVDECAPPAFTPDYEFAFVRSLLEASGAVVLNAFVDDKEVFSRELANRCGKNARPHEVTDSSDIVNFFPSLAGDITASALSRELERSKDEELSTVIRRIDSLRKSRPYSGGGTPFVESRLSADWQKSRPNGIDAE